jgi:3-hydroxyisobutyrate dehydrogenase-like beta-hydroxyacid dehydrogenase
MFCRTGPDIPPAGGRLRERGLVTDAARASAFPAPLASAAEQLYVAGRRACLGRLDDSSVITVLRGGAT